MKINNLKESKEIIEKLANAQLDYIYDEEIIKNTVGIKKQEEIFEACKINLENYKRKEFLNNFDLLIKYDLFLIQVLELLDLLHIHKNELEKAMIIEFMLHKGYLSYNNKFNVQNIDDIMHYSHGINIITGNGVCRHIANFYRGLAYSDNTFSGILTKNKSLCQYRKQVPNHIINIISYHDSLYGIDLTNKTLFNFDSQYKLIDCQNPNIAILYTSHNDLFKSLLSITEIKDKLNLYDKASQKDKITKEEYQLIKCNVLEKLYEKKKILESFSMDTNLLKAEINEKMLLKK